jgi:hypothetical protein
MHQPRHAIDVQTIKMGPGRPANSARAVYHGISTAHQAPQTVGVFKRPVDPNNIKFGKTAPIRCRTGQGPELISVCHKPPGDPVANKTRCPRQSYCRIHGYRVDDRRLKTLKSTANECLRSMRATALIFAAG